MELIQGVQQSRPGIFRPLYLGIYNSDTIFLNAKGKRT